MLVSAPFDLRELECHLFDFLLHLHVIDRGGMDSLRRDLCHLAVCQIHHLTGMVDYSGGIRSDKVFTIPHPNKKRTPLAGDDKPVRLK